MIEETEKIDYLKQISKLDGPILVTGAAGFIGASLFKTLLSYRSDVYGIARKQNWRILGVEPERFVQV